MESNIRRELLPRTSTGSNLWVRRLGFGNSSAESSVDRPTLQLRLPFPASKSNPCLKLSARFRPQCSLSPPPSPERTPPEEPVAEREAGTGFEHEPDSKLGYTRLVYLKSPQRKPTATSTECSSPHCVALRDHDAAPESNQELCSCRPDEPGALTTYCKCGRTAAEHAPGADLDPYCSLPFPLSPEVRPYAFHTHSPTNILLVLKFSYTGIKLRLRTRNLYCTFTISQVL